jgi:hypothetical protein
MRAFMGEGRARRKGDGTAARRPALLRRYGFWEYPKWPTKKM